ncbi:MAG: N-acetylmuramoyl-L-alanine amidase [Akkermansiaceae bacterium]|nr:N-acetylmuramoyl-L-alanine amidase [Akkermansiaceae bacterium]
MVRRCHFCVWFCLIFLLLGGCQQQVGSGSLRTPRAFKFEPSSTPIRARTLTQLAREANIKVRMVPARSRQRQAAKRIRPTFLTIHSTANHSPSSTAMQHSRALCRGAFSNRSWHFTVDQYMVVQNLPLNESGWHAGNTAGNMNSLGIEMCEAENRGQNHFRTWDRTAKLVAVLMKRYNINLRHVVPHYHWTGKNCPTPLLTNGRPGPKWGWFLSRVDYYYRCINNGVPNR